MLAPYDTSRLRYAITSAPCRIILTILGAVLCSQATIAQNADSDALLESAWRLESQGNYNAAAQTYHAYLLSRPAKSAASRNARLKLPVLQEAAQYGKSIELDLYLSALNSRAAGDTASALVLLQRIISCLLYTSPSPRDGLLSRMPSSA